MTAPHDPPTNTPSIPDPIKPGLMVIHGNRLEDLRDLLAAWLARAPLRPLEDELMLVQSNGIAQWLKMALARPAEGGGLGISAAIDMQLPGRFLWAAYRAVLGRDAVPPTSPFDKSRLTWRLMRLLPAHLDDADFAPLRTFLGAGSTKHSSGSYAPDPIRQFQLSAQISDLFDQYQVYRADWLDDWEHSRDVLRDDLRGITTPLAAPQRWQAKLWRLLLDDIGAEQRHNHRAAVHHAFVERLKNATDRPSALPRRIVVFGISSLPQQTLEALAAVARFCQVLLLVANPCRHYWADIVEDRELLKAAQRRHVGKPGLPAEPRYEDLHMHAHPLLAAWGKQGRDYIRLLDVFDRPDGYRTQFAAWDRSIDLFEDVGEDTLLHQVQQAILDLEPLPDDESQRRPLAPSDTTLRFHITHNPQREVEVLHDQLLAMFEQAARDGKPLAPRDVMVMVPDIQTYAPHVQAVFGRLPQDDPRYLPYSVADQPGRGAAPLLVALEHLLHLPESRFAVSEILDLLDVPALRKRYGFDEDGLPVLRRWIEGAGIRWGLHGTQKENLDLPPLEQNSWRFGLRRMLLGYAVGDGASLDGIAPYAEVGGLDAALLGPLSALLEKLEHYWQLFATSATPTEWNERLRALLADCFDATDDDADANRLDRLDHALETWQQACDEAGFAQPIPLDIVREHWLQAIDESHLSQRFMGGAVSFGTLMPMRAIPFRVVCLLGMNDGDYPRRQTPPDFDLMAQPSHHRPGDRSRRDDDRYLFLEALLSARAALHVSWVGRSARDNGELPPSVLVGQLRDYLAAGWHRKDEDAGDPDAGKHLLATLTTEYPLQPFSRRYFDAHGDARVFTYADEWQRAHQLASATDSAPLSPWQPEAALSLAQLQRFLSRPVEMFFGERLKVHFSTTDEANDDDEPFALDGLQNYSATHALLQHALSNQALADSANAEPLSLVQAAQRLREQGAMPPGGFGTLALETVTADVQQVVVAWQAACAHWTRPADIREVRHEAHGITIEDWLGDLRHDELDGYVRLLPMASRLRKNGTLRYDKLLAAWAVHLLANANGLALTTHVFATDTVLALPAIDRTTAVARLDDVLAALRDGMQKPLPIARKTAFAWLLADADEKKNAYTLASRCYDGSEGDWGAVGEVAEDACLARTWSDFAQLHAAGFEDWLHLYRPLLEAVSMTEGDA